WGGEKGGVSVLDVTDTGVHDVNVRAQNEQLAAPVPHPGCVLRTAREDTPRLLGGAARPRNGLDRLEATSVLEIAGHAQHLTEVGRADEQQVDVGDGGDLSNCLESAGGLDLDADKRLGIRLSRVFGQRNQSESAVAISSV